MLIGFDRSHADQYQFETRIGWLPFGSDYRIGVDGLSIFLVGNRLYEVISGGPKGHETTPAANR